MSAMTHKRKSAAAKTVTLLGATPKRVADQACGGECRDGSQDDADEDETNDLAQNEQHDAGARCAEGHAYAELHGSLGDPEREETVNADAA